MNQTNSFNGANNFNNTNKDIFPEKPAKDQWDTGNCNEHYHSVFEQATDAIMVTDFEGNFKDVNSSLCTMFGYTKEELLQLNVRALLDPESLKLQPLRFDLLALGQNVFNERKMVHRNGTIVYVEANAKKLSDKRILVIARDITERKKVEQVLQKSEANLQTIFDTTDTIYVLMDTDLRIISYNLRAFAFAKNELGHSIETSEYFLDYFPSQKRPILLSYMKEVLTGRHVNYQVSYPQADSSINWYHVRMFPISKGDKNIYGLMMAVSDITEKVVLEQMLDEERIKKQRQITDAVITAEENERQEIGRELHDSVNQVLAAARLYLAMAQKEMEKNNIYININEADNLIDIAINEIRNLSHSLISPFLEDYGLLEALDHLTKTISATSRITVKKEIKNIDESLIPEKFRLAIYRIIQEQVNNILKYAKAKTVHLKLIRDHDKVMLSIQDDGVGFDTSVKSTGIGLMNIRTRASLFNGKVNIISSPGNGCELIVNFN
jgi:PAS domain S-box-containing protein